MASPLSLPPDRMLWRFERLYEVFEVETYYDPATTGYVLAQRGPGPAVQVERYESTAMFRERLNAVEERLEREHWRQSTADPAEGPAAPSARL